MVRDTGEQDIFSSAHFYFSLFNILLIMLIKNENIFLLKQEIPLIIQWDSVLALSHEVIA